MAYGKSEVVTGHQTTIDEVLDIMKMLQTPYWTVWDGWQVSRSNTHKRHHHIDDELESSMEELHRYLTMIATNGGKFQIGFAKKADSTTYSRYRLWVKGNGSQASIQGMHSGYNPMMGYIPGIGAAPGNTQLQSMIEEVRTDERRKVETEYKLQELEDRLNAPPENDFWSKLDRIPPNLQIGLINMLNGLVAKTMPGMATNGIASTGEVTTDQAEALDKIAQAEAQLAAQRAAILNASNQETEEVEDQEVYPSEDPTIDESLMRISEHFEDLSGFMKKLADYIEGNPAMAKQLFDSV